MAAALLRKQLIEFRRYLLNTLTSMVSILLIFLVIFYGARTIVAPGTQATTLSGIVVGFFMWTLALFAFGDTTGMLVEEAQAGTLEQLAMSRFGLATVLVVRFYTSLVLTFAVNAAMLVVMMATSGRWLHVDVLSVAPLVLLTVTGVFGLGLALGGLALVAKRMQAFLNIMSFVLVGVLVAPLEELPLLKLIPLALGARLVGRVMVDGESLATLPTGDVVFLVVHALVWLVTGIAVFKMFEAAARDRALLGQY